MASTQGLFHPSSPFGSTVQGKKKCCFHKPIPREELSCELTQNSGPGYQILFLVRQRGKPQGGFTPDTLFKYDSMYRGKGKSNSSEQEGLVFADKGKACPVWYQSPDGRDKAHPRERLVPGGSKWKCVPHLSSLLMSTPTEGGAARMSVMSGRNLWRMSFRDVQPVCT